jgi:hypothetical protein
MRRTPAGRGAGTQARERKHTCRGGKGLTRNVLLATRLRGVITINMLFMKRSFLNLQSVSDDGGTWAARALVRLQPAQSDALVQWIWRIRACCIDPVEGEC